MAKNLDDSPAEDAEKAWNDEVERRARDVLAGRNVVFEDGAMFRRLRDELSGADLPTPSTTRRRSRSSRRRIP